MADYTDDFERGNGTLGSNWTAVDGTMQIFNGTACGNASGDSKYSGASFSNDQYSEVVTNNAANNTYVLVRANGADYYYAIVRASFGDYHVNKWVGGVDTNLVNGSVSSAIGDTIRLEISGTGLTLKLNGATVDTASDSSIASGSPGIGSSDPGSRIASWAGGDLGGSPDVPFVTQLGALRI